MPEIMFKRLAQVYVKRKISGGNQTAGIWKHMLYQTTDIQGSTLDG